MSRKILVRTKFPGLGKRIKEIRGGVRQKEFGKIIGVTSGAVSQYESETIYPSWDVLKKIADYGGVSVEWLLHGEEAGPAKRAEAAPAVYEARPRVLDSRALARAILLAREFINRRRLTLAVEREAALISFIYDFWATEKRWPDNTEMEKNLELLSQEEPENFDRRSP
jgi:transcriptional regulator with XRE-family HTH domain